MTGPGDDRIDLVIAEVLARRAVGGSAETLAGSPLSTDEALVAELAALSELDCPADQAGDRIAMTVTAAGSLHAVPAAAAAPAAGATRDQPPVSSRWLAAGAAAVAVALVGGVVQHAAG